MKPYYQDEWVTIYHGDCREILPQLPKVDLVLTDPPYPDQHPEYGEADLSFLSEYSCRQLIFWSAKVDFPLDYTAIHIWDKQVGCASEYERIFERNGQRNYKLFSAYGHPSHGNETYYGHPSQKSMKLISRLINYASKPNDLILDPFGGSGTTPYCAKKLNRRCIMIETVEKWCEIAANRCRQSVMVLSLLTR